MTKHASSPLNTQAVLLITVLTASSASFCTDTSLQLLVPGTIVTGQCQGHETEPGCVLPKSIRPHRSNPRQQLAFSHFAHFVGSAQTTLNQTVSTAIATQLAILPIISPASGFTYKYDSATGAFVRTTTSLGPVYTERAETIGRGKASFGVSYQRFRFQNLDGIDQKIRFPRYLLTYPVRARRSG